MKSRIIYKYVYDLMQLPELYRVMNQYWYTSSIDNLVVKVFV